MVIIYLHFCLFPSFISLERVPLPKFGLLARGVYPFHLDRFQNSIVTVALYKILGHSRSRSRFFRRQYKIALAYFFAKHEHYKHLSLCEHGLSSVNSITAIIRNLLSHLLIFCCFRVIDRIVSVVNFRTENMLL